MTIEIPKDVLHLIYMLETAGFECYMVGGAVRSALLGLPVHDYDLTTNALPSQMQEVFQDYPTIATGLKHGTLTVLSGKRPIEITTYRTDGEYLDHRHPKQVVFSTILEDDCSRRDFTINALCYHPDKGILDFFNGRQDLQDKVIRAIGEADKRFNEDALRILRALRFAAKLDFEIEPNTCASLYRNQELLRYVSAERIREEFDGLLNAQSGPRILFEHLKIVHVFLPEIDIDPTIVTSLRTQLDRSECDSEIRLALILNAIGHDAHSIMKRMKYSNHVIRKVMLFLKHASLPLASRIDIRKAICLLEDDFSQYISFRKALDDIDSGTVNGMYEQLKAENACCSLRQLAINGNDMVQAGLRGKEISEALQAALSAVNEEQIENQKDLLLEFIKKQGYGNLE